jgi:hypothetical protein
VDNRVRKGVKIDMNTIQKRIASAIATGALLVNAALPAFAVTIEVSGNGSDSVSGVSTTVSSTTSVVQDNTANVTNNVSAVAQTGANKAKDNTGGNVSVTTGNATTSVGVANTLNANIAEVEGCCDQDLDILVSDNGSDSENDVYVDHTNETGLFQTNVGNITNNVDAFSSSGGNKANGNTDGDVAVSAGNATTTVLVANTANLNSAHVGGGNGTGGSVSVQILENGEGSQNNIELGLSRSLGLLQDNYANLQNNVDAVSQSGANEAVDNTGGEVSITNLDAETTVGVDNLVNFNFADLDCGCLLDVLAKISDNGEDSENDISAELVDEQTAFQANVWACNQGLTELWWDNEEGCNNVDAFAGSGGNLAHDNTGDDEEDGSVDVDAGNATSDTIVGNEGNVNVVGDTPELPELDLDFDLGFNLLSMWSFLTGDLG